MSKEKFSCMLTVFMLCICGVLPTATQAAQYKVLAVMSYEEELDWCKDMKAGIDFVLGNSCEIKYFYMDTKNNLADGPSKAAEAFALYQEFRPDGVIAADDNAQSMFVVPYLKDKVKTPVMFCGVNADPEKYGYPASNVSGILERMHINESIALATQLVPSIKTFAGIEKNSPTGEAYLKAFHDEADTYLAKFVGFELPKTITEAVAAAEKLKADCDLLFMATMKGIPDENGKPLTEKQAIQRVATAFGKPTFSNVAHGVKYGILCAVVQRGWEQGETAAKMLLKSMEGTPVSQISITRNQNGKAMVNVAVLKALGIKPDPMILHSAELVKTEE